MLLCCVAQESCDFLAVTELPRGVIPYQEIRGLVPKFESEILVGAPNFASKNISDKYPKFCPLNFRYDPKIGIFHNFCVLLYQNFPSFPFYLVDLAGPCPKFCQAPSTSQYGSTPSPRAELTILGPVHMNPGQ